MSEKKRYTFTLDESVVKEAKKLAIDKDMSLSALIQELLLQDIKKEGNKK